MFDFVQSMLSADLIEEGAFCHFRNPATGELAYLPGARDEKTGLYDESKAVGGYVRYVGSKANQAYEERALRRSVEGNRKVKNDTQRQEMVLARMKAERAERFSVLVARLQNTSLKSPGVWEPTEAQKLEIAGDIHNKDFVDQMLAFSQDASNFPGAEPVVGKGDAGA